ncbi:MAG: thioredoxin family protein [Armatimonadota bacterium]
MPKITLIVTPKKCQKCLQCEDLVARLLEQFPGQLDYVELDTTAEEVQQFGVVLPPMLLLDDFIAAAGKVPIYDALARLITAKLPKESR